MLEIIEKKIKIRISYVKKKRDEERKKIVIKVENERNVKLYWVFFGFRNKLFLIIFLLMSVNKIIYFSFFVRYLSKEVVRNNLFLKLKKI